MRDRLEQIYRDHRQGLFSLALAITRSVELAEDAVHEAFLRLWRSGREPSGELVPYVFASVRNAAIEQAARRRKTVELNDSLFGDGEASPPAAIIACEQARLVRQTVDRLPLRQRQVVVLRAFGELTFHQIAEVLGEPLPTVASRYQRALRHMRETIEKGQERP